MKRLILNSWLAALALSLIPAELSLAAPERVAPQRLSAAIEGLAGKRSIRGQLSIDRSRVTLSFRFSGRGFRRLPELRLVGCLSPAGKLWFEIGGPRSPGIKVKLGGTTSRRSSKLIFKGSIVRKTGKLSLAIAGASPIKVHGYELQNISAAGKIVAPHHYRPPPAPAKRPAPWAYQNDPRLCPKGIDFRRPKPIATPELGNEHSVRFALLGDWGLPGPLFSSLASGMERFQRQLKAKKRGLDAVILAGDNFYPWAIKSLGDPRWESLWARPLRPLGVPFLAVLGNHDYKSGRRKLELPLAQLQVTKSGSPGYELWTMRDSNGPAPGVWYADWKLSKELAVQLIFIDTNLAVLKPLRPLKAWKNQLHWLGARLADSPPGGAGANAKRRVVRLVIGHHPLRAFFTKKHESDYLASDAARVGPGATTLIELVRKRAHAYLCGHVHGTQYLNLEGESVRPAAGPIHGKKHSLYKRRVLQILSGSAAEVRQLSTWDSTAFYTARLPGFTHLVINRSGERVRLHVQFVDTRSYGSPRVIYSLSLPLSD